MSRHALLTLLCAAIAQQCLAAEHVLVRDGRSAFAIVRDDAAPASVKLAAEELRDYLRKAAGVELPVASNARKPMICLGDCPPARAAGFALDGLPLEGFRIATRGGSIYIHGPDTADRQQTPLGGFSRGTLFGVYTFLERFVGVRWLVPGPQGEHVPKAAELVLPDVSMTDAPDFARRRIPYINNGHRLVKRWSLRNKLGESIALSHGHNWRRPIPASLYDDHPDYFALRGGKRVPPVGRYKLCTANPALVKAFADAAIKYLDRSPNRRSFSLSPSDGRGWCECERCTALDEVDPNGKPSLTKRILTFYNEVAKIVGKRFPDRILCGYVYSCYVFPPQDRAMRLEPNLFLVWAPSFDYGFTLFRPQLRDQWDKAIAGWTSMTHNIAYYDLCVNLLQEAGAPNPPGVKILKHIFPRLHKHGMKGLYVYGVSAWGHAGLLNYLLAKLSWDAEANVDALLHEFCTRAYGKGAEEMEQICRLLDAAMERHFQADLSARYTLTPAILKAVYLPNFAKIETLHHQALANAADPGVRARLDMFGDNLKALCWNLDAHRLLPKAKDSSHYLSPDAFSAFMAERAESLALQAVRRRMKRKTVGRLEVRLLDDAAASAEPIRRYGLRGDQDIIIYSRTDGPVQVAFTTVVPRGRLIRVALADEKGKVLRSLVARRGVPMQFDGAAGKYHVLRVSAGSGTYAIATAAPFAVDAGRARRGLHFQGHATPVYFHVGPDTKSFALTLASDAPGETAAAKLYDPSGKLAATFRTVHVPADKQTVQVGQAGPGIWKMAFEKAEKGAFDDVYLEPGPELTGFFSLAGHAVLEIRRPRKR